MDSTEYEPGTVAVVTARGVEGVRAMWRDAGDGWLAGWFLESGHAYAPPVEVTDVRPLLVLSVEEVEAHDLIGASEVLRATGDFNGTANFLREIAESVKPPRIPEPGTVGSLVRDGARLWVRSAEGSWVSLSDGSAGTVTDWAFFTDPTLIREGLS